MTVIDNHLVRGAHDGESSRGPAALQIAQKLGLVKLLTLFDSAMIHQDGNGWRPFLEFVDPI